MLSFGELEFDWFDCMLIEKIVVNCIYLVYYSGILNVWLVEFDWSLIIEYYIECSGVYNFNMEFYFCL